jgi:hypothetical protein
MKQLLGDRAPSMSKVQAAIIEQFRATFDE